MIRQIIYIVEILSVLKCIHCVYGEKQKLNFGFLLTVVSLFVTMVITNKYSAALEGTFSMYCILTTYCILVFRKSAKVIVINTVIYMIVSTIIQVAFLGAFTLLIKDYVLHRTLIADISTLLFCYCIMPLLNLNRIAEGALRRNILLYISIAYIFLIITPLLLKMKIDGNAHIGICLSLIPFIICLYLVSKQWRLYQDSYEIERKELQLYREDKQKFDGLISNVRSRQHEINNHIMAIMSLHYTADTYEELVGKQSEYCNHIIAENKFNSLLGLYNSILPGYLMDKFSLIESRGISVECKIVVSKYEACIPEYHLVEMLGILLDNAAEAVGESASESKILFEITQTQSGYEYVVRNPYRYVPYEELEAWFNYEKSSKGADRGIGLYHLKSLCAEWNCVMTYRNVKFDDLNWIEFKVRTDRNE